tara:strand:- start:9307 stop:9522 length:216 start_codon:yes stop_codon:yes gene_type:complete
MKNQSELINTHLTIGSCVEIQDSNKTFQVIGIDKYKSKCWMREWPITNSSSKSFELKTSMIIKRKTCITKD